jgi:hypothetical protein
MPAFNTRFGFTHARVLRELAVFVKQMLMGQLSDDWAVGPSHGEDSENGINLSRPPFLDSLSDPGFP